MLSALMAMSLIGYPINANSYANDFDTSIEDCQDEEEFDDFIENSDDDKEYESAYKLAYVRAIELDDGILDNSSDDLTKGEFVGIIAKALLIDDVKKEKDIERINVIASKTEGMTREAAAVVANEVITQFCGYIVPSVSIKKPIDINETSYNSKEAINNMIGLGIMKTNKNGEFLPKEKITKNEGYDIAVDLIERITGEKMYVPIIHNSKKEEIATIGKRSLEISSLKKSKRIILDIKRLLNKKK